MTTIPTISPELSIDLRLRFLETLLLPKTTTTSTNSRDKIIITRKLNLIQSEFKTLLNDNQTSTEALRRFVLNYDLNEPLLRLPPLSPTSSTSTSSSIDSLNPLEKVVLILESELEIRNLEKELREIELLDQRGVVGAGKLADHEGLKDGLKSLTIQSIPLNSNYSALENKTEVLLSNYNDYINTVSEIFINWNDIITSAEEEVTRREKEKARAEDIS